MTKCAICEKDAMFFTELYDNEKVFRNDGRPGVYTLFLCDELHRRMLREIRNDLIRMRWKEGKE